MDHYYTENPTSKSEERELTYTLFQKNLSFISDNGVFSKNHVDFATDFLIKTIFDEVTGEILDVGCGYGVIGICLAMSPKVTSTTMLDINHRALDLARRNAQRNHAEHVQIIESNGFEKINDLYDTIITNPPIRAGKEVIYQMYQDAKDHLKQGGKLFLVINKKHGAPSTIRYLEEVYGNCEIVDKKAGFHVLMCIKEDA